MPRQLRNSGKVSEKRPSSCPRARWFGRTGTLRTLNVSSAPRTKSSSRQSCSGGSSRIILRQDLQTAEHLALVCGGSVAKTLAATSNGRWLSSGACSARGLALAAHPSSGERRGQLSGDSQAMRSSEDIPRARYFRPLRRDRVRGADREWGESRQPSKRLVREASKRRGNGSESGTREKAKGIDDWDNYWTIVMGYCQKAPRVFSIKSSAVRSQISFLP